jgi:aminoglycoside 6'-N-acetyltransferase
MATLPTLQGSRLILRPATAGDADALHAILSEPEVARWWGHNDIEDVRSEAEGSFAVVVDGEVAGWLQVNEEPEPEFKFVAFDIALTSGLHGRGYGREALRLAIDHFVSGGHHRFTIDPAAENERAIRSYAAVGFKPVGVLRAYERLPDGTFRDGLLMDLLAGEL